MSFKTEQETFWAGEFGVNYIQRNISPTYLAANLAFFSKALSRISKPGSVIEFGANVGMNLKAIQLLFPEIQLNAIEINEEAARVLKEWMGHDHVFHGSILDFPVEKTFDLVLIKGVLIHQNPEVLPLVYDKLYQASHDYILVCEYYNPSPVAIPYRGHENKLFKRDFAGEMLQQFPDLKLIDYGFCYHKDPAFPQDDITWFLLKKEK